MISPLNLFFRITCLLNSNYKFTQEFNIFHSILFCCLWKMKQFSSKSYEFFNLMLPALVMLIITISFVSAISFHAREMAKNHFGMQQRQPQHFSSSSSSADDSKENLVVSKSDEDDSSPNNKLDSDNPMGTDGAHSSSSDCNEESDEHDKSKPLEITFNCYPQAEPDVFRHIPQHSNRTIRQSAHIKLYSHCEEPKVTRLQSSFLMECGVERAGREIGGHFVDYMDNRTLSTAGYSLESCGYIVGADCIGKHSEMQVYNTCHNQCGNTICDQYFKEENKG